MADLLKGLTNSSPSATDKSTQLPKSPSVNNEAVRTSVASQPKTLGPRCA